VFLAVIAWAAFVVFHLAVAEPGELAITGSWAVGALWAWVRFMARCDADVSARAPLARTGIHLPTSRSALQR
jgi:hypothetical protein